MKTDFGDRAAIYSSIDVFKNRIDKYIVRASYSLQ